MTKCDFCTKFDPIKQKCWWNSLIPAESDCKKAIKQMNRHLSNIDIITIKHKKHKKNKGVFL